MRRTIVALALLAIVAVVAAQGTFSSYTDTRANTTSYGTASNFVPVNKALSVASASSVLSVATSTWGYAHSTTGVIDPSSEPAITSVAEKWQYFDVISSAWHDVPGATTTSLALDNSLRLTLGLLSLTGTQFRLVETASNSYGAGTSAISNVITA
ncbi:MAG: hypothetical protein JWM71_973 [Solirubrobacteraceae bacterium]|nr:hypothetical protein [Solirubrobacteraceae bacterium]